MKEVEVKCPAKINLFFNIIGLDDRNYHLIHGLNQSISLYDKLYIKTNDTNIIKLSCSDPTIPVDEKNSVYKAAKIFLNYTKVNTGLDIHIEKHIPTQSGLGGESTDAAGTILTLNYLFKTNLSEEELNKLGYQTSCDVPFCIKGGSKEVKGCGEIITEWQNPYKYFLVITPNIGHSTQEMFKEYDKQIIEYENIRPQVGHNDFHKVLNKEILDLIDKVKSTNCITAMLTGSGSSVIGIYNNEIDLDKAYISLKSTTNKEYLINKATSVNGIEITEK